MVGVEALRFAEKNPLGNVRVLCNRNVDRPLMQTSVAAFGVKKRCECVETESNVDGDMSTFEQLPCQGKEAVNLWEQTKKVL